MNIIIVGNKCGKHKVSWFNYFALSVVLSLIMGLGTGSVYYMLADRWDHSAVLYGILMGSGIVTIGLIRGLKAPIEKLSILK